MKKPIKKQKNYQNFAAVLCCMITTASYIIQIFFTLKKNFVFLPTTFAVILTPVALASVPKLEFDFEVIMYIAIFTRAFQRKRPS